MVGVPTNMENFFHDFAVNVVKSTRINLPVKQREEAMQLTLAGFQYFLDLIKERREAADPGNDFIGSLVSASDNGDSLNDYQIVSIIQAVIVRSEERRGGKECVSQCRSRCWPLH